MNTDEPTGRWALEVDGSVGLVPAQDEHGTTRRTAKSDLTGGMMNALITSPGFRPALAAGEPGRTATTRVPDRIAKAEARDVDGLAPVQASLVRGGVSSGVTVSDSV